MYASDKDRWTKEWVAALERLRAAFANDELLAEHLNSFMRYVADVEKAEHDRRNAFDSWFIELKMSLQSYQKVIAGEKDDN